MGKKEEGMQSEEKIIDNPTREQTMRNILGEEFGNLPGQTNMLEGLEDMENMANGKGN